MPDAKAAPPPLLPPMLEPTLAALVEASLLACDAALARVWLTGPGDLCPECPLASECASRAACLHLVASAGLTTRVDGPFRRFPIGARSVGRVPVSHEALIARADLPGLGVAEPAWLARHGVRSFAALPLEHGVRCLGVLAVFSRDELPLAHLRSLAAAARLGAEALGNASAYRAIARERNRYAAKAARLQARARAVESPAPSASGKALIATAGSGAMIHTDAGDEAPLPSFAEVQRQGILRALERSGWRVSGPRGAAARLGLKPTTLESKMKKLGIRRPPR